MNLIIGIQPSVSSIIFNLKTGEVENIPTSLEGFEFDAGSTIYWISSDVILVKMHRFPGGDAFSEEVRYLRYDLQNIESFQVIEFSPCSLKTTLKSDSHVLLLASDCDFVTESTIYAIDIIGKRLATHDEFVYFNRYHTDCRWNESCIRIFKIRDGSRIKSRTGNGRCFRRLW